MAIPIIPLAAAAAGAFVGDKVAQKMKMGDTMEIVASLAVGIFAFTLAAKQLAPKPAGV